MLFDDTARSSSCPLLLSFLFNVNIIPATLSSSELAVVPELGLGRRAGGWRQVPSQYVLILLTRKALQIAYTFPLQLMQCASSAETRRYYVKLYKVHITLRYAIYCYVTKTIDYL